MPKTNWRGLARRAVAIVLEAACVVKEEAGSGLAGVSMPILENNSIPCRKPAGRYFEDNFGW